MRYVMVPVPSQFVMDVLRLVVFRAPPEDAATTARDQGQIEELLSTADDQTRTLVIQVASGSTGDEQLRFADAADLLEITGEALSLLVRDINDSIGLGEGRELIGVAEEVAVRVHGNVGRNRYLVMRPEHAKIVRALTRAPSAPAT